MILVELQYFPSINYFKNINSQDVIIDSNSFYVKKTYRNRSKIVGQNGFFHLIIPTIKNNTSKKYSDIKIDYSQNWINQHLQSLQSSYGKTPYFIFYKDLLVKCLKSRHIFLFDLNYDLLTLLFKFLNFDNKIKKINGIVHNGLNFNDGRHLCNPVNDEKLFNNTKKTSYNNNFGKNFDMNISILDLLFVKGPETGLFVNSI
jgi:hypothetical protein